MLLSHATWKKSQNGWMERFAFFYEAVVSCVFMWRLANVAPQKITICAQGFWVYDMMAVKIILYKVLGSSRGFHPWSLVLENFEVIVQQRSKFNLRLIFLKNVFSECLKKKLFKTSPISFSELHNKIFQVVFTGKLLNFKFLCPKPPNFCVTKQSATPSTEP